MDAVAPVPVSGEIERFLAAGAGVDGPCERVVDTSIARVFLFKNRVLKLKKPADFGFLDFSSVEKRRWALERELAFNRATAPDLYRAVMPIVRRADGVLALGGAGEALDWVLEMRRFPDGAVLADQPERIDGALAESLGREVARFHTAATPVEGGGERLDYVLNSNEHLLRQQAHRLGGPETLEPVLVATREAYERLSPLLIGRAAAGLVRRCHGDLHLGNIFLEAGRPILFDCIEFNDLLSQIDILYDFAFLLMDLGFRGADAAANRALNGWLDEAARGFDEGRLWQGLALLPLFQSVRAAVRTHVSLHQAQDELARAYLAAAHDHLRPPPPRLLAVGGRSGSGKSTYARAAAPSFGARPGAVVLRSDEIRKRLWGCGPLERLPPAAYTPEEGERVYAALFAAGAACLDAGLSVVLDAAFLKAGERDAAERLAAAHGTPFEGVWMEAPPETLMARVGGRRGDASDADVEVLRRQLAFDPGDVRWRRVHDAAASGG